MESANSEPEASASNSKEQRPGDAGDFSLTHGVAHLVVDVLVKDPIVLAKWIELLYQFTVDALTVTKIQRLIQDYKYYEAILETIRAWITESGPEVATYDRLVAKFGNAYAWVVGQLHGRKNEMREAASMQKAVQLAGGKRQTILPSKWWPGPREVVRSYVNRMTIVGKMEIPLVDQIRSQLLKNDPNMKTMVAQKQALIGMSGCGKTSLAKWYAKTHENAYDYIIWMESEGKSLLRSFTNLAKALGVKVNHLSMEQDVQQLYSKLADAKCLFIFDNVDNYKQTLKLGVPVSANQDQHGQGNLPINHLPTAERHHTIITSKNHDWGNSNAYGKIPTLTVPGFSKSECLQLFALIPEVNELNKSGSKKQMLELCAVLGYHPLTIQCAIATIIKTDRYNVANYLARVRVDNDMSQLLENATMEDYGRSVHSTMKLAIEEIERMRMGDEMKALCKMILCVSGYCRPDQIPVRIFNHLPGPNITAHKVGDAVDLLTSFSLLTEDRMATGFRHRQVSIHRLMQYVLIKYIEEVKAASPAHARLTLDCIEGTLNDREAIGDIDLAESTWEGITQQIQSLIKEYPHFPNLLVQQFVSVQKVASYAQMLGREFDEHDPSIVALRIRLIYELVLDRKYDEAKTTLGELMSSMEAFKERNPRVPIKQQLIIHLRLLAIDIDFTETQRSAGKVSGDEMQQFLQHGTETYKEVLDQVIESEYNGTIGRICPYYGLLYHLDTLCQEVDMMSFRSKVALNYGRLLMAAGKLELAAKHLWEYFESTPIHLMSIQYIEFVRTLLEECVLSRHNSLNGVKVQQMYDRMVRFILEVNPVASNPAYYTRYKCILINNMASLYFMQLINTTASSPQEREPIIQQFLNLTNDPHWPTKGRVEIMNCARHLAVLLVNHSQFKDAELISKSAMDNLLAEIGKVAEHTNDWDAERYLVVLLQLNHAFAYALIAWSIQEKVYGMETVRRILKYDDKVDKELRKHEDRELNWTAILKNMGNTKDLQLFISDCHLDETRQILRSKIALMRKLVGKSKGLDKILLGHAPVADTFGEIAMLLVSFHQPENARSFWTKCIDHIKCIDKLTNGTLLRAPNVMFAGLRRNKRGPTLLQAVSAGCVKLQTLFWLTEFDQTHADAQVECLLFVEAIDFMAAYIRVGLEYDQRIHGLNIDSIFLVFNFLMLGGIVSAVIELLIVLIVNGYFGQITLPEDERQLWLESLINAQQLIVNLKSGIVYDSELPSELTQWVKIIVKELVEFKKTGIEAYHPTTLEMETDPGDANASSARNARNAKFDLEKIMEALRDLESKGNA